MTTFIESFKNFNFVRLWTAQLISQIGDRFNQMALIALVAERSGFSTVQLAKLMTFTIIPVFVVGPIAGVFVDRWDRKTTLFVCDIVRGIIVLLIPWVWMQQDSMIPIYISVFLVFCFSRFYVPAKMSIIPEIVDEKGLHIANSLVSVTGMIAVVIGALVGGLIGEYFGAYRCFTVDASTFFISALLIFSMGRIKEMKEINVRKAGRELLREEKNIWKEMIEGIRYVGQNKEILFIIKVMTILFMAAGAIYVVLIVFIQEAFNSVTKDLGFLAVALGVGLFIGSLLYGRFGSMISRIKTIFLCLLAGGVMIGVFTLMVQETGNRWVAMALAALLGLVIGPITIASNTIVHLVSSDEMRGKVFSALEFVMHLGFLATMLLSSKLAEVVGSFWILVTVGGIFIVVGLAGLARGES